MSVLSGQAVRTTTLRVCIYLYTYQHICYTLSRTVFLKTVTYTAYGVLTFRPLEHLTELATLLCERSVRFSCALNKPVDCDWLHTM